MFNYNTDKVSIYKTEARDFTVIRGFSSFLYPFYCSTGQNSLCASTWFPWMGYFNFLPHNKSQLYMVKPFDKDRIDKEIVQQDYLSEESLELIHHFLGKRAPYFIYRMGNDETLALSASLQGGIWAENSRFHKAILEAEAVKNYLRVFKKIEVETSIEYASEKEVMFNGLYCSGKVVREHQAVAAEMEKITSAECKKKPHLQSVQAIKCFPKREDIEFKAMSPRL